MRNINFSQILKNNWIHLLAIGLFLLTTFIYFSPQFSGHRLKQHDIEQFKGMSNEIVHYRDVKGEEPLWTNSMFGGMPTYQISTKYEGNLLDDVTEVFRFGMGSPAGIFVLYLIGFYIMLLCMRVNPKVAIFGAFAFAFSTYFIIILQAGHNSKAAAIGLMGPVIGAFYMAFRYNLKWGVLLSALFMGLQLSANHFQITYYLGIVLIGFGVAEFIRSFQKPAWKRFFKATLGILVAYFLALGINYGNITLTNDYAKHTIRGGNDISIQPGGAGNEKEVTSGLDKDYITQWSYGVDESLTLLSPYIKGGASGTIKDSQFAEKLREPELRRKASLVAENNVYWGEQPFVSGPVYLGIIVFFLALLGMIYLKGPLKWTLAAVTVLALMLSWGKNFMGLTDLFLDYLPGYNKFRAVTIILSVVELTIPILAVLFLNRLFKERENIKQNIKPLYIASGGLLLVLLILTFTGTGDGYLSPQEEEFVYSYEEKVREQISSTDPQVLRENNIDINNPQQIEQVVQQQSKRVNEQFDALVEVRKSIYQSSMLRSIFFLIVGIGFVLLYLYSSVKKEFIILGLGIFTIIDLVMVDWNYLNTKKVGSSYVHWMEESEFNYPMSPTKADMDVMNAELENNPQLKEKIENIEVEKEEGRRGRVNQNKLWSKKFQVLNMNTNYRVYEPRAGFSSSRPSYFHKALNGYHGAKLRRIQNVKDFHIDYNNMEVLNMLNVKYFLQQEGAQRNPNALGNAWFVEELVVQPNPNMELLALDDLFLIQDVGQKGDLIINSEAVNQDTISGKEDAVYFINGDSTELDLQKITSRGINSAFVMDINGNTNWIPTKELEKDTLDSFIKLITVNQIYDFEPARKAVVSNEVAKEVSSLQYSGKGKIEFDSYLPNELKYKVSSDEKQFAVFSEVYYPDGWKAYLDGEEIEIHRVNYFLRGVEVPAGDHELVMKFEVPKFDTANNIALAGSILIFLVIAGAFVRDFLLNRQKNEE